ncbi:MAG: ABC transporter ATP-binding protein, partial [Corynebacterium casei]
HNMAQAIQVGNRLIMMHDGQIIYEASEEEKKKLTVQDLMSEFAKIKGATSDRTLLQ